MYWRAAIIIGHVALALTFSFVLGGGVAVLMLFGAWWLVWAVFALFGAWTDRRRYELFQKRSSS